MSDERLPDARICLSLRQKHGNKTTKIHLYLVKQFKTNWNPNRTDYYPKAPMQFQANDEYFNKNLYRIRIKGKWLKPKAQYTFYTIDEIMNFVKEAME